ncbi:MAG TPA: DNA methyltransferase, partial [Firmicutes bacterium]|nr:DNA methyltransferase [Bacillota bacterium]
IIFTKTNTNNTNQVWFYDMKADGYSLDDKRNEIEENDIPDIITRFKNLKDEETRKRTEQSFLVPKDEIVTNRYDLSINRYKEIEYEEVEYEKPQVILERLKELEAEIGKELDELEKMVG